MYGLIDRHRNIEVERRVRMELEDYLFDVVKEEYDLVWNLAVENRTYGYLSPAVRSQRLKPRLRLGCALGPYFRASDAFVIVTGVGRICSSGFIFDPFNFRKSSI